MKKKIYHIIIIVISTWIICGCNSKEIKKAKEYMDAAMYTEAIPYLELEIQDNPKNAEASFLLGKCYLEIEGHEQEKIEKLFNRAILLDDDYRDIIGSVFYDKAIELYKKKNDFKAKEYYEYGLEYFPTATTEFAQKVFDYAVEFSETSTDVDRPIELFQIVDKISPEFKTQIADRTYSLATKFIEKGFVNEGFTYADFGIKYDPKHIEDVANLYLKYGKELVEKLNEPYKSIKYFEEHIKLRPGEKQKLASLFNRYAKEFEEKDNIELLFFFGKKCVEYDNNYKEWFTETEQKHEPIYRSDSGIFTDSRDGQKYKWVKIGNQVWSTRNLDVTTFRNGDQIQQVKTDEEWEKAGAYKQPAWCYYDNNPVNGEKYGKLYNWYAVNDPRGLSPLGWHIPSDAEWTELTDYLGGEDVNGQKMKSTSGWVENGNGNDKSGFSGLPCGFRDDDGAFGYIGEYGIWWSSTERHAYAAWNRDLSFSNVGVYRGDSGKAQGLSVRCLRD
ncbi:MAG: FISUMP domain-containing protein [Bacteroidales bacterium]|jgi:uncharacterized protein (TIGR02145 family)|nr:FISUMP domain-containing protein [Bacteroidales bacterium]